MPVPDSDLGGQKMRWADEVDESDDHDDDGPFMRAKPLPPPSEKIQGDLKTIVEYKTNEDNQRVKIISYFRVEKRVVSRSVANRKNWKKFGESRNDKPGPNRATTIVSEDVFMQLITGREDVDRPEESVFDKLKATQKSAVKCRHCKDDHWTSHCPYKDVITPAESLSKIEEAPKPISLIDDKGTGKYVPPSKREGATRKPDSLSSARKDDTHVVRVSNLSESTQENDLKSLFEPFGPVVRFYLAKDKNTGNCKGFAFVHYKKKEEAESAIASVNGHGYDHLILSVEWAKPSGTA